MYAAVSFAASAASISQSEDAELRHGRIDCCRRRKSGALVNDESEASEDAFLLPSTLCAAVPMPPVNGPGHQRMFTDRDAGITVTVPIHRQKEPNWLTAGCNTDTEMPVRELSHNSLARLEASLRNALDHAEDMQRFAVPTADTSSASGTSLILTYP